MASGLLWQSVLITSGLVGGLLVLIPGGAARIERESSSPA
jgi:hypothetical protein